MKKLIASTTAGLLLAISSASWAGSDSGLYIGGSLGSSGINTKVDDIKFDEDATGYKLILGYNFGLVPLVDLAVEADYRDFGSFKNGSSGIKSDVNTVDLYGVAGLNFGPFGVFAKAGYADADFETHFDGGKFTDSDSSATYGLGAKFQLGSLAVRAEYETFDLDNIKDLSMWSVGATVTF